MQTDEKDLLTRLSQGDSHAFAILFRRYYRDMVLYAGTYIQDLPACEDIVQNVFLRLWTEHREAQNIRSLKSFLLKSVQNGAISHLRHLEIRGKYADLSVAEEAAVTHEAEEYILYSELMARLEKAMTRLTPEQRRCFEMNRLQGIRQKQIADELQMPLRTVEFRIAEALRILKEQLKDYFPLIALLLFR
ncbi:MAG: RNA polymerase sigma-70 factor [Odoribacter sp.]|nr:RNA polymerase sigma-70 factor [Odoribacter sp.]